jgi:hypothetical protein
MAEIKKGILGGGSGKVGNVTMTSWKGIDIIKGRPNSVANPNTAGQVTNRGAFKLASQYASAILASMIIPLMNRFAKRMSGYNLFVSYNKQYFGETDLEHPESVNFGSGKLGSTVVNYTNAVDGSPQIDISWDAALDNRFKLATDKLYILVVGRVSGEVLFQGETAYVRNSAGAKNIQCVRALEVAEVLDTYAVFLRANGTEKGETAYAEVTAGS